MSRSDVSSRSCRGAEDHRVTQTMRAKVGVKKLLTIVESIVLVNDPFRTLDSTRKLLAFR